MARVKRGVVAKARHKKVLKKAKGYYGARSKFSRQRSRPSLRPASMLIVTVVSVSGSFGHFGSRVSMQPQALHGMSYSRLINGLNLAEMEIDRKGSCGYRRARS